MRAVCLAVCAVAVAAQVRAQTVPVNFTVEDVATGFTNPVDLVFGPDGRMFVAEQAGRVWLIRDGVRKQVLDISAAVNGQADRGLLGFAVHPDYDTNGYVYVLFTVDPTPGEPDEADVSTTYSRLERWTANPATDVIDPASRVVLVGAVPSQGFPACHSSHSIGTLKFGEDGMLYAGSGDGAHFDFTDVGGHDPGCFGHAAGQPGFPVAFDVGALRSQLLETFSGKILRIDPITGQGLPTNPYWTGNANDARSKIWALGLRNPYRFTVRPGDGRLYVGDVGWNTWEEMNVVQRGGDDFGWPCYEGDGPNPDYRAASGGRCDRLIVNGQNPFDATVPGNYRRPSVSFMHPDSNAVSGVAFYVGGDYPRQYMGRLFQADVIHHWIRMFSIGADGQPAAQYTPFVTNAVEPVDVEANPDTGDLYYISMYRGQAGQGRVRRIGYRFADQAPVPDLQAAPTSGQAPLAVQFDASGSSDPDGDPITFAWDFGDGGTSTEASPQHTYVVGGSFLATLTVSDDRNGSSTTDVLVEVAPPPQPEPFFFSGTQPRQLQVPFDTVANCSQCHAGYEAQVTAAPGDTWAGSMMANSARDPVFQAALAVANQTVRDGGSFCLRCHAPVGWLGGRSLPADGSGLFPEDRQGVSCAFCHRLDPGANRDPAGPLIGQGQFYLNDDQVYRGPRGDAQARHATAQSAFFDDSALCGACHSVSSPTHELQGAPGQAMPEQRTYEEWEASAFSGEGTSCQDCHMPTVAGRSAGDPVAPVRPDIARHDFVGGNAWGPLALDAAYPGERPAAYAHTRQRALEMLAGAADVSFQGLPAAAPPGSPLALTVRVANLTGHKLPTGYPDGRRMWLEVTASANGTPYFRSGAYDVAQARLVADPQLRQYRAVLGAGGSQTFDFLANDTILEDTRIPPRGFAPDSAALLPVGRDYRAGAGWRSWDDAPYSIPAPPAGAANVTVTARLLYQPTTREFVEFLRDEDVTDAAGTRLFDLWQQTAQAAPVEMATATTTLPVQSVQRQVTLQRGLNGYAGVADATVSGITWTWVPETQGNFGGASTLQIYDAGVRQSLVSFDLGALPAGAQVTSATLRLYVQSISYPSSPAVDAYAVTQSWIEGHCTSQYLCTPDGVTWTARGPGLGNWTRPGGTYGARVGGAPLAVGAFTNVDVTSEVAAGRANFLLRGRTAYANDVAFASSESANAAQRPALIVTYTLGGPCAGPGPFPAETCDGADQDCDDQVDEDFPVGQACSAGVGACLRNGAVRCNGAGGAGCDAVPGTPVAEVRNGLDDDCDGQVDEDTTPPGTLVLQRGAGYAGWADATVSSIDWTWVPETRGNFGASPSLLAYDVGVRQFLVRFDLAPLPAGAVVQSARLYVYVDSVDYPNSPFLQAYRLTQTWTEGTCASQYDCAANGVTWLDRGPGLGAWSTPGGAFAEMVAAAPLVPGEFAVLDVTPAVRAWRSGTANAGLVLRGTRPYANDVRVSSAEDPTPGLRPYVEIQYTLP
jgi:glucose/arabinose dehydrogenase